MKYAVVYIDKNLSGALVVSSVFERIEDAEKEKKKVEETRGKAYIIVLDGYEEVKENIEIVEEVVENKSKKRGRRKKVEKE